MNLPTSYFERFRFGLKVTPADDIALCKTNPANNLHLNTSVIF